MPSDLPECNAVGTCASCGVRDKGASVCDGPFHCCACWGAIQAEQAPSTHADWWKARSLLAWMERIKKQLATSQVQVNDINFAVLTDASEDCFIGVGARKVWACTQRLGYYLGAFVSSSTPGVAIELGAGVGIPGMLLARHGWRVCLTDLPWLLPLTSLNVESHFGAPDTHELQNFPRPSVHALRWGQPADVDAILSALGGARPDLCCGGDICYFDDDLIPLLDTLRRLNARVNILAIQRRNACDERLISVAREQGWLVEHATTTTYKYSTEGATVKYTCPRAAVVRLIAPEVWPAQGDNLSRRRRSCLPLLRRVTIVDRTTVACASRTAWHFVNDDDNGQAATDAASPSSPAQTAANDDSVIGAWPLTVRDDPLLGRFVVASRDLQPGELVFTDTPFAQTVHDQFEAQVCHTCYALLPAEPHVCAACNRVRYCSAACAAELASAHDAECEVLQAIGALPSHARLYLRILARARVDAVGFGGVEELTEHYDDCSPERRAQLDEMARGLISLMPMSQRMECERVARVIERVHTNAFAVSDCAGSSFGTGLYVRAGSLFNHSCSPLASVSFVGRTLRVHSLRAIAAGEAVTISYTEIYAGRAARRAALKAKKGFDCVCVRCVSPPAADATLEGWCCAKLGCDSAGGAVAPDATSCKQCGTKHSLAPTQRAELEERWRGQVEETWSLLLGEKSTEAPMAAQAAKVLPSVTEVLEASEGRLCATHAVRHKAMIVRSYALGALSDPPPGFEDCLVDAIEDCLYGMRRHLDPANPQVAFFLFRRSQALVQQARVEKTNGSATAERVAALRRRAAEVRLRAAQGLAVAYGADHPKVVEWREASD